MRAAHTLVTVNLDLIRSFFAVIEHGSLSRAAVRLRVSQSTLTRQMHALEHAVGGRLLERNATGVALTAGGRALHDGMRAPLEQIEAVIEETRRIARGQHTTLRIGYLASAARAYLNPALAALRRRHPEVKVKLLDLSPGEQIAGLRHGTLDLALLGNYGALVDREFFVRRLATLGVLVGLPEGHALAGHASLSLADLRSELFVGAPDGDLPGYNQWVVQLCRRARFRPRFVPSTQSLAEMLATTVAEGAVALLPAYVVHLETPGVVFRPLRDTAAKADLSVAWQRGKLSDPVRAILEALPPAPG
jgi:DNA-binding transcriptional LysR family regulator